MKNTRFEQLAPRVPHRELVRRLRLVLPRELTPLQQQTVLAYYFEEKTIPQIARERGVQKSTVSRTLKRAESRLRRFLQY